MSEFYDGPAKYSPPARKYPDFFHAYTKKIEEAQRCIEAMRGLEPLYALVAKALEDAKLPNEIELSLHDDFVNAEIRATPDDSYPVFEGLIKGIGLALKEAGLHGDGIPSRSNGGLAASLVRDWSIWPGDVLYSVRVEIKVPKEDGMRDLYFEESTRTWSTSSYKLRARPGFELPQHDELF